MERTGSRGDAETERFERLTDAFRCFASGSRPGERAADVARAIFAEVVAARGGCPSRDRSAELTCISLTLVEKMTSCSLGARDQTPEITPYYEEVQRVLFEDLDLMSQLVHQFQAEDQIISHLAAKTVSARVFCDLHKSSLIPPAWQQACVQAFHSSPPCPELDACLWSLTGVLKRLLREKSEHLGKLLSTFDPSLSSLCSRFLPVQRDEATPDQAGSGSGWATTFCLLLDLLEVLTASGPMNEDGARLRSQRLTYLHASALLWTAGGCSQHFVRKRALLLLKRAVLQKAGEDWALGEAPSAGSSSDLHLLAQSVLRAVAADWLQHVPAEPASFFGGPSEQGHGGSRVTLRAISLLLLKSLELHLQTAAGTGQPGATEGFAFLQTLWSFLGRHGVQREEVVHRCCWVSLLFGEQDDDMMEAAKALLSIFLHYRTSSGLDAAAVLEASCAAGCNPHCHFLLLLRSVSFDHSTLLDFLISTETCFLEYFVRYLKCLGVDRRGFAAACRRASGTAAVTSEPSSSQTGPGPCPDQEDSASLPPLVEGRSPAPALRLVEYDSSEESDADSMEVSEDLRETWETPIGAEVKEETCGSPASIRQTAHASSDSTESRRDADSSLAAASCDTSARAMLCLSELRRVVTRLHARKLFPYNPSSLLKLLEQREKFSHH